ncbi:MAG: GAF and ANTAR domain-containing protein [Frankiaceae bacterium]
MASVRVTQILSGIAEGSDIVAGLPQRLVSACARALPVTGVGLVLMTDKGPAGMVAATDGPAKTMEDLQFTLGEGPCVDSSRTGRPVLQPDLARSGPARWPGFSAGALAAGIRAIFAFPLQVGGIRLGVLDLYRDRLGVLSDDELAEALSFADAAKAMLLHLQAQDSLDGAEVGAIPVIEDRAEVHQASGMISVQADVTLAQALVLLRARAFAAERPILDLARDVLGRVVRFRSDDEGQILEY